MNLKQNSLKTRRIKIIAAVCAVTVLAGSTAGIYAFSSNSKPGTEEAEEVKKETSSEKDSGIISGGGTVTSSQLSDQLGLKNTSARLTVGEVLAESGNSVTAGTELYKLTDDSLEKAKKTLDSELKSATNALTEKKTSAQADKIKAKTLYESQLLLGDTAEAEYEADLSALDTKLQNAYDDYQEAQNTVNNTPSEISRKQSEMKSKQSEADSLQAKIETAEKQLDEAEKTYTSAASDHNALLTEYNSAASVVRYLGAALGNDTSNISLAEEASTDIRQSGGTPGGGEMPSGDFGDFDASQFDMSSMPSGSGTPAGKQSSKAAVNPTPAPQADAATGTANKSAQQTESSGSSEIKALYDKACKEYTAQKEKLDKAEKALTSAEKEYKSVSEQLSELNSQLKDAQNSVSELSKEISSLESTLSKAKSNLTKLRSEYNSLKSSYETDKLELKNKLDTDLASYENAEFHYNLTCSTIDSELAEKQEAYDTAVENLNIYEEQLSDGYVRAMQDGTVYSLSGTAGRSLDVSSPFVYYVDRSDLTVTVELDQYDVTEIAIGDTVIIYSSETGMTNGKITAIAAGEATSLADVRFNVTVTAEEDSKLYSGQSVNVYFNYTASLSGSLKDFAGKSGDGEEGSGSGFPGFGGGSMPEGFDPRQFGGSMPEGFDPSNMPSFGGRKGE
ncbi:MAG: HlyD family efflux transporter periplasmic adaptor subunit [Ruminococcus sp.]|nr:HlyD family efflux transporter periplasmic adaptor subunit [Ruminococcus sp.]